MSPSFLAAALLSGFFGSTHCVGMCGGIAGVLAQASLEKNTARYYLIQLAFQLGRISTYMLLGLLLGAFVATLQWWQPLQAMADLLRALAALMLVLMGLYLARWWNGLAWLEKAVGRLWLPLQKRFLLMGARSRPTLRGALTAGALWGLLPCGLVYSAVTTAALQPNWGERALFMLAFGFGTVPALMFTALVLKRLQEQTMWRLRKLGALSLIVLGCWTLLQLAQMYYAAGSATESGVNQIEHQHHAGAV